MAAALLQGPATKALERAILQRRCGTSSHCTKKVDAFDLASVFDGVVEPFSSFPSITWEFDENQEVVEQSRKADFMLSVVGERPHHGGLVRSKAIKTDLASLSLSDPWTTRNKDHKQPTSSNSNSQPSQLPTMSQDDILSLLGKLTKHHQQHAREATTPSLVHQKPHSTEGSTSTPSASVQGEELSGLIHFLKTA